MQRRGIVSRSNLGLDIRAFSLVPFSPTVNLFRTIPGCVLTFVSYEVLLKKINQYNGN